MLLSLVAAAHAAVLFGVAWSPPGVGALAWSDADNFTDTLAGEYDGLLRPPLTAHGGWIGERVGVTAGVAAVSLGSTTWAASTSSRARSGVRLSLDGRFYPWPREAGRVGLYGDLGLHGILPGAHDTDDAFTTDEQAEADEAADADRARIGGVGGQAGLGAEWVFADKEGRPAVALGARYVGRLHVQRAIAEDSTTISRTLITEAAIVVEFMR